MPMYEYECVSCGRVEEDTRKYEAREDPGPSCPACGAQTKYMFSASKAQTYRLKNHNRNRGHNLTEV